MLHTRPKQNLDCKAWLEIWDGAMLTIGGFWPTSSCTRTEYVLWWMYELNYRLLIAMHVTVIQHGWQGAKCPKDYKKKKKEGETDNICWMYCKETLQSTTELCDHMSLVRILTKLLPTGWAKERSKVLRVVLPSF